MEIISPARARAQAENELMAIAQDQRRNALLDAQMRRQDQTAQFEQQRFTAAQEVAQRQQQEAAEAQQTEWIRNALGIARQNPQAIPALVGQAKQRGLLSAEVQTLTPEDIETLAMHFGLPPRETLKPEYRTVGDSLLQLGPEGVRVAYREPQKTAASIANPEQPRFRVATPQEVAAANLPEGTSAQVGADGKLTVIRAPDAASVRERMTARRNLPRIDALGRRVDRVSKAVEALSGGMINTGPVDQYITQFTKNGQELEQAVLQAQSELQALTRIPGVGTQSDWEGRMQLMTWPSVKFSPEVNARAVEEIQRLAADLKAAAYQVSGHNQSGAGASGSWNSLARVKFDEKGRRVP